MDADPVLREQIEYYRARAPEYDRWFFRQGRYDRGEPATRAWFDELAEVRAALAQLPLDGADVLELAPGTGLWTHHLAQRANHVTAIDASDEMVQLARDRLGSMAGRVSFVQADLFDWQAERTFDAVVFCFWISHVPDSRLDAFLQQVARGLRPGGSVFFLDARREPTSTAADHQLPAAGEELMVRRLDDGRQFTIVKRYRPARLLEDHCAAVGLAVEVHETATHFQYGVGTRHPG